jgi:hypothetical protein
MHVFQPCFPAIGYISSFNGSSHVALSWHNVCSISFPFRTTGAKHPRGSYKDANVDKIERRDEGPSASLNSKMS